MPNNRNAEKAMRQANKRRLHNRSAKSSLRSVIKKTRSVIDSGDSAAVVASLRSAEGEIDSAASKKYIHRNKAARLKSRLAKRANKKTSAAVGG
jgi:small subunit ribosomal protein S20